MTLAQLLEEARRRGFLGGPVAAQLAHAEGFVEAAGHRPARAVDLGTGGGVPGLVLALRWPETEVVLVDSHRRKCRFLEEACTSLDLRRAVVVCARAEEVGRDPTWRTSVELVTARAFGPPAVTAECAAPLLVPGGRLVVSEPPAPRPDRWPEHGLATVGLRRAEALIGIAGHFQVLVQESPCPPDYPRRVGLPAKRPLW